MKNHFELTDSRLFHHRTRPMAAKHIEFIRKKLDNLLDANNIVPASASWAFPVVTEPMKDGNLRSTVDSCSLKRVIKADS